MNNGMQTIYTDFSQFSEMRSSAQRHEEGVLEDVVEQFESVFVQMVLSSMRDASAPLESDLFSSDQSETYKQMYDQQLGLHLSEQGGIGLADVMLDQIRGSYLSANDGADTSAASTGGLESDVLDTDALDIDAFDIEITEATNGRAI